MAFDKKFEYFLYHSWLLCLDGNPLNEICVLCANTKFNRGQGYLASLRGFNRFTLVHQAEGLNSESMDA